MPNADETIGSIGCGEDLVGLDRISRERLLNVDVQARLECPNRDSLVRMRRRCDVQDIRPSCLDHTVQVVKNSGDSESRGSLPCQIGLLIAHAYNLSQASVT